MSVYCKTQLRYTGFSQHVILSHDKMGRTSLKICQEIRGGVSSLLVFLWYLVVPFWFGKLFQWISYSTYRGIKNISCHKLPHLTTFYHIPPPRSRFLLHLANSVAYWPDRGYPHISIFKVLIKGSYLKQKTLMLFRV